MAELGENGKVLSIEEKPKSPKSNYAVTGLYIYDNSIVGKTIGQHKSGRGEYEITSINNLFVDEGSLRAAILEKEWFDTGTFDSLLDAAMFMREKCQSKKC